MEIFVLFLSTLVTLMCDVEAVNMTGCKSELPFKVNAVAGQKGDIYSPGYLEGSVYPDHVYCVYDIWAPSGYKVKLTFADIEIEDSGMCGKDVMYVYDGSSTTQPVYGVYCGSQIPDPIISSRNAIHILFVSNFMVGKKGFHMQYEAIPRDKICPDGMEMCKSNQCYDPKLRCDGNDDCGDGTDEENCGLPIPRSTCGESVIKPIEPSSLSPDRVIGGIEVRKGSWPWQADLQIKYYHPNGHNCGGTLIHPQWVMTAMHCLRGHPYAGDWRIHLGKHNKFIKHSHEQIRYVERLVVYPGYTDEEILGKNVDLNHDITLMKLNAPVKITDYVRTACIPPLNTTIPAGETCIATGWGTTRGSGYSEALKQVDLTIQPTSRCPGSNDETQICVKSSKGYEDVCHGDSGGPLVCKIGGKWNVMGITSYGIDSNMMSGLCALGKSGTVFNRVAAKTKWIDEMIQKYS